MHFDLFPPVDHQIFEDESKLDKESYLLVQKAKESCKEAYAPYSGFFVGAAILLDNGKIVSGNNQENAAYPSGLCAERVAIFSAGANYPNHVINKVAVVAKKKDADTFIPVTPCGACRQVLLEYEFKQNKPIELIMRCSQQNFVIVKGIRGMLPISFNKDSLA